MSTLSVEFIASFRTTFDLSVFIETGCYEGAGIHAAHGAGFNDVRSCDLDANRVTQCQERFGSSVRCLQGRSIDALSLLVDRSDGPTFFWLDAHYPAFFGMEHLEDEQTRFPVLEELALIRQIRDGALKDVIVIDDLRVIDSIDNPRWADGEVSDYYRITHVTVHDIHAPFAATHNLTLDPQQEGLIILTPRSTRA